MAKNTVYEPLDFATGYAVADETYTDTGSNAFGLGEPSRPFQSLTISTGAGGGGTVLVKDTDYTLATDTRLTTLAGATVYRSVTITNATYQTGTLYFNYTANGSYVEWADVFNRLAGNVAKQSYTNLSVERNSTNPDYQIDITADEIYVGDTIESTFSDTIDITQSGAGGLDTGSEATATMYYIYLIAGEGQTTKGIFSTNPTAPTLPSGYTDYRRISGVYNKADGNFRPFDQKNKNYTSAADSSNPTNGSNLYTELNRHFPMEMVENYSFRLNGTSTATIAVWGINENSLGTGIYYWAPSQTILPTVTATPYMKSGTIAVSESNFTSTPEFVPISCVVEL